MKKRVFATLLSGVLVASLLSGCGGSDKKAETKAAGGSESASGSVYYLNFKPEADAAWQELAAKYTEQTGVEVKVVTAASGEYENTLTTEMSKSSAPTLFQCGNQAALDTWKDYCLDLSDTDVYKEMTTDDFNLKGENGEVYAIGYCYEAFGIITNKALLAEAGYDVADIKDFESLKKVAEDITARKDELGFSAFSSAGLDGSSSWRFSGHLMNMPLFYEFRDDNVTSQPATVTGAYLDNFKAIWDLYINNATCEPNQIVTKTGDESEAEFGKGEAVFFQNGTWEYDKVKAIGDENLAYLPIYFGVDDENQGICMGTENFWCVNGKASEADQKATLDFMNWCVTSDKGVEYMTSGDKMGFNIPFKANPESKNTLFNLANANTATPVSWNFTTMPSEDWKNVLGQALTVYAADQTDANWATVEKAFVDNWAAEKALTAN